MANFFAFTGRLLFAVLFLTSGVQKLINYDFKHGGGALTRLVETKMNTFNHSIHDLTGVQLPLKTEYHQYFLLTAIALETLGGLLFVLNFKAGAVLLLAFLASVTPVIHDFWNEKSTSSQEESGAHFFKNVALAGALIFYLASPRRATVKLN